MRQKDLDELQRLVNEEQQNLCSVGKPLIQKLLDEATPDPEPPKPPEPPEYWFDLDRIRARVMSGKKTISVVDAADMIEALDRVLACHTVLEAMGIDARRYEKGRHSHYAVSAMLLRRAIDARCVTPNGREDGHMMYVKAGEDGKLVCAFCGRVE